MTFRVVLEKLDDLEKQEGALPELLQFYRKLLLVQAEAGEHLEAPSPGLTGESAAQRLPQGQPLLTAIDFAFDWALFLATFRKVADLFSEFSYLFGLAPQAFKESPPDRLLSEDVVRAWFEGSDLPSSSAITKEVFGNLIHAAIRPFLVNYSKALIGLVNQAAWRRGHCPVCGGNPDFGYLDTENGARWLVCSRCDAKWLFQRLECPYCRTTNQNDLSYYANDEGVYRLYVCERCKRYLKTVDLRSARAGTDVSVERLLTFELDAQAREYGYLA